MGKGKRKRYNKSANEQTLPQSRATEKDITRFIKKERYLGIRSEIIFCVFLTLITAVVYSNTLHSPFVFDDLSSIVENAYIRLTGFDLQKIWDAGFKSRSPRPVANISFAVNYYFGQYNPVGYHLVNIVIHIINSILIFFFVKTTLAVYASQCGHFPSSSNPDERLNAQFLNHSAVAFFTALLWLVNPVHTNCVTYLVQRMNSMAAMFYLLSMLFYIKGRIIQIQRTDNLIHNSDSRQSKIQDPRSKIKPHHLWFTGCFISGILALGCKQIAATLPFIILLYEWYFFQDLGAGRVRRYFFWLTGGAVFLGIVATIYLYIDPQVIAGSFHKMSGNLKEFTAGQRILTEFRVVVYYMSLLFFPLPSRLNLDYDFPISYSLIDPVTTLFSLILIALIMGFAVYVARRQRIISFCILWFFGNLVIESSVVPLAIIFEHRTYLPSMLVPLLFILLLYSFIKKRWLVNAILCLAITACGILTYERNKVWKDEVTLWSDCLKKSPQKARLHTNLGLAFEKQGNTAEALSHYQEALRLNPELAQTYNNLGLVLLKQGKTTEAIKQFSEAVRINPGIAEFHANLGTALVNQGRVDEGISHYYRSLQVNPMSAEVHSNLGVVFLKQGNIAEAIKHFSEVVRINPANAEAYNNLGLILGKQGDIEEAIKNFSKAVKIDPKYGNAHGNMGVALLRQGKTKEAIGHFSEAIRINPDNAKLHNNLGAVLLKQGNIAAAIRQFSEAVRIDPEFENARNNLNIALSKQGKISEPN